MPDFFNFFPHGDSLHVTFGILMSLESAKGTGESDWQGWDSGQGHLLAMQLGSEFVVVLVSPKFVTSPCLSFLLYQMEMGLSSTSSDCCFNRLLSTQQRVATILCQWVRMAFLLLRSLPSSLCRAGRLTLASSCTGDLSSVPQFLHLKSSDNNCADFTGNM